MSSNFIIQKNSVHLWRVILSDLLPVKESLLAVLSPDERARADRLKFEIHQQRFRLSRALLRSILNLYTGISPGKIVFHYGKRGKPYLENSHIKFNVSHSDDIAVYALAMNSEIGVDVEKIQPDFKEDVAKRFFSPQEYQALQALPVNQRIVAFYRIWAKKEALIKALGEGLFAPLDAFSVSTQNQVETIELMHENQQCSYSVHNIDVHPDYQAAFAISQKIDHIDYWQWTKHGASCTPF